MSKKKTNKEETVQISKEELEKLYTLAEMASEQTETKEDDEFVEEMKDNYKLGSSVPDTDNSRWELDVDPVIESIIHSLKREYKMADGQYRRPSHIKAAMNDEGVFAVADYLRSLLTKNIALANITQKIAHQHTKYIMFALVRQIKHKHRQWGLHKADFDYVTHMIDSNIYFHFTRPINEGERKYRGLRLKMSESYSHDEVDPSEIYGGSGKSETVKL